MIFEGDEYAKRTLDFVQKLQQLSNYDEVCNLIISEMEWFGFTCLTSFTLPGPDSAVKDGVMLNTRPAEYTKRYYEKNYVIQDPAVKELRRNLNPYSWGDIRKNRPLDKGEKSILDEGGRLSMARWLHHPDRNAHRAGLAVLSVWSRARPVAAGPGRAGSHWHL